jgi:putative transposase
MPWKINSRENQRWEFVREWLRHKSGLAEQCRRWEVSRKTAYKWILRFEQDGRSALSDQARTAERVHNRPSALWLGRIKRWRSFKPTWGAPKLRWLLQRKFGLKNLPSEAAISRWLKRWGLSKKRRLHGPKGPVLPRPKLTVARRPNDVWTVDFKGWYRTGNGTRVDALTVRDQASCCILAFDLMVQPNLTKTRQAFEKLFHRHGLPSVIRSDNGRLSVLRERWV